MSDSDELNLQYRPNKFDDWGVIRHADGSVFATVRRPVSDVDLAAHRSAGTDPYQDLALRLMATFGGQRDERSCEVNRLKAALERCKTSICGFNLDGSFEQAASVVSYFYNELSRINRTAREALDGIRKCEEQKEL